MKRTFLFILLAGALGTASFLAGTAAPQKAQSPFSKTTIDFGIVVSDLDKAIDFYRDALGLTEIPGFDVTAEVARDSGLTKYHPFHVKVMVLGKNKTATNVKLMSFPQMPGKKVDNTFIHSSLGVSYLTIHVSDMASAVQRAEKANATFVKPTYELSENFYLTLLRDPDGNFIELVGPNK